MQSLHNSTTVKCFNKDGSKEISNLGNIMSSCVKCMNLAEICVRECDSSENCVRSCVAVSEACSAFIRMCSRGVMDRDFVNVCIELCQRCCKLCKECNEVCCKECDKGCEEFVRELNKCFC